MGGPKDKGYIGEICKDIKSRSSKIASNYKNIRIMIFFMAEKL